MQSISFVTSWDDGHPLDLRVAELLHKHGFAGTFYVPIVNVEGLPVMSAAALRHIDSAFEVGSHTYCHLSLNAYADDADALREIESGKQGLEQLVGHAVHGFCFPDGEFRPAHVGLARRAGVAHARTVINFSSRRRDDDGFLVDTSLQLYPHPRPVMLSNWLRSGHLGPRAALARIALREPDLGRRLARCLEHVCRTHGGVFHLWGHSWEMDRCDGWRVLDEFLRFAADHVPFEARKTVSQAQSGPASAAGAVPLSTARAERASHEEASCLQ